MNRAVVMEPDEDTYVGLMQLAEMMCEQADHWAHMYAERLEYDIIRNYHDAIEIHASMAQVLAIYYENEHYPSQMVEANYLLALAHDSCAGLLLNFADFLKNEKDFPRMIQYLQQAIELHHDPEAMIMLAFHYANLHDFTTSRMYYDLALTYDHFSNKTFRIAFIVTTSEKIKLMECLGESHAHKDNQIFQAIQRLCAKDDQITVYQNKVRLFTTLNHVVECGVCYDVNLHLDLSCGHCVCKECYIKLLSRGTCPFCRMVVRHPKLPTIL